ncbi:suppressor APC domain-containing protein 1 [Microcaecilia unicolor]|uniref:Suppressor APC domain-containing protein 1 n=1 Tax=Microcaecilia unicolor TaxID=1415580 RepID=A0A6P7XIV3_9AMPH|nr:suppressor APC domain-containing protein 1 [Microcaecilia unicolor]
MSSVLLISPDPRTQQPGLPGLFLRSLHTLFNILDEEQQGAVHMHEIESRWGLCQDSRVTPPPEGVLDALRHVSAPNGGYLTFPSLVAGLKLALLLDEQGERGKGQGSSAEDGEMSAHLTRGSPKSRKDGDLVRKSLTRSHSISGPLIPACSRHRPRRGEEPRRHTLTHGINYTTLKQMKELEQERDALLQGLEMVEKARDWYCQKLLQAQDRWHTESCGNILSECYTSHSCLLLTKIQEVNQCLGHLISCSGKVRQSWISDHSILVHHRTYSTDSSE